MEAQVGSTAPPSGTLTSSTTTPVWIHLHVVDLPSSITKALVAKAINESGGFGKSLFMKRSSSSTEEGFFMVNSVQICQRLLCDGLVIDDRTFQVVPTSNLPSAITPAPPPPHAHRHPSYSALLTDPSVPAHRQHPQYPPSTRLFIGRIPVQVQTRELYDLLAARCQESPEGPPEIRGGASWYNYAHLEVRSLDDAKTLCEGRVEARGVRLKVEYAEPLRHKAYHSHLNFQHEQNRDSSTSNPKVPTRIGAGAGETQMDIEEEAGRGGVEPTIQVQGRNDALSRRKQVQDLMKERGRLFVEVARAQAGWYGLTMDGSHVHGM